MELCGAFNLSHYLRNNRLGVIVISADEFCQRSQKLFICHYIVRFRRRCRGGIWWPEGECFIYLGAVAETWRRVCGMNYVSFGKNFHFHGKNFWWPFLVIDQAISNFPFLSPDFPYLYYVKCRIWPFHHKKNHYFRKEFLHKTNFYSVHPFARIRQHYFSKYWGTIAWAVPPPKIFGGTVPPSPPPRSPPLNRSWLERQ